MATRTRSTAARAAGVSVAAPPPVPYQRPQAPSGAHVMRYYALAEEARWYSNGGPCSQLLTQRVAARLGGDVHVVPVANCTLGILLALRAACGEPHARRRRIVVPSFTFTASACAIAWAGFEPLFADVDPDAWQLDPAELERLLAEQGDEIAGVLATTTFGTAPPAEHRTRWRSACAAHGVPLVIDAAAAFGALDADGLPVGADGDTAIFSLHATKPASAGEGGLVVTGDAALAARIAQLENFGLDPMTRLSVDAGMNAKLSELGSAAALAMLDELDETLSIRRANVSRVRADLRGTGAAFQQGADRSTWQVLQLTLPDGRTRDAALRAAAAHAVEARTCFDPPLHRHPAFADAPVGGDLRATERLAARSLSLPMANDLTPSELERIAAVVLDAS